jgi:hypothetical protein
MELWCKDTLIGRSSLFLSFTVGLNVLQCIVYLFTRLNEIYISYIYIYNMLHRFDYYNCNIIECKFSLCMYSIVRT